MSAVCEAFGCRPSEALEELLDGDADLVFAILEMRGHARAKAEVDATPRKSALTMTPAIKRVFEIEAAQWRADRQRA